MDILKVNLFILTFWIPVFAGMTSKIRAMRQHQSSHIQHKF
ncbi:hypothetical protein [Rickettsia endosymbiont of Orchestes rusci]